jgi:hypothetical protein
LGRAVDGKREGMRLLPYRGPWEGSWSGGQELLPVNWMGEEREGAFLLPAVAKTLVDAGIDNGGAASFAGGRIGVKWSFGAFDCALIDPRTQEWTLHFRPRK